MEPTPTAYWAGLMSTLEAGDATTVDETTVIAVMHLLSLVFPRSVELQDTRSLHAPTVFRLQSFKPV